MKKDVYAFWEWVDDRMIEIGIPSYRQLESSAGFANGAIGRRKNDAKLPTVEMAEGLCRALRVSWCELWEQAGFVQHVTEEDLRGEEAEIHRELEGMPERSKRYRIRFNSTRKCGPSRLFGPTPAPASNCCILRCSRS